MNQQQIHKFTVTAEIDSNWVVKLPSNQWDMNIMSKDFTDTSDTTFVNLFGFGLLVETIYSRICDLTRSDKIEVKMLVKELINKHTFVTSHNPTQ